MWSHTPRSRTRRVYALFVSIAAGSVGAQVSGTISTHSTPNAMSEQEPVKKKAKLLPPKLPPLSNRATALRASHSRSQSVPRAEREPRPNSTIGKPRCSYMNEQETYMAVCSAPRAVSVYPTPLDSARKSNSVANTVRSSAPPVPATNFQAGEYFS